MTMQPEAVFATKTEWIYRALRSDIVEGRFAADERLPLAALAARFSTSEMPVREALRMLQRDGLVDMESHRGATVAALDWEHVVEAVAVRTHLELLALEVAVPLHTGGSLAAVRKAFADMGEAMEIGDAEAFTAGNRGFHTALYEPGPMALLKGEIQELWDRVWRTRSRSLFGLIPARMQEAQDEHAAILEAVSSGNAANAVDALKAHVDRTLEAWRMAVEKLRDSPEPRAS